MSVAGYDKHLIVCLMKGKKSMTPSEMDKSLGGDGCGLIASPVARIVKELIKDNEIEPIDKGRHYLLATYRLKQNERQ